MSKQKFHGNTLPRAALPLPFGGEISVCSRACRQAILSPSNLAHIIAHVTQQQVQSFTRWAPASLGPYSQAVKTRVNGLTLVCVYARKSMDVNIRRRSQSECFFGARMHSTDASWVIVGVPTCRPCIDIQIYTRTCTCITHRSTRLAKSRSTLPPWTCPIPPHWSKRLCL